MIDLINYCAGVPILSAVRGQLFEQYVHNALCSTRKFETKSLESRDSEQYTPTVNSFELFKELSSIGSNDVYYGPGDQREPPSVVPGYKPPGESASSGGAKRGRYQLGSHSPVNY